MDPLEEQASALLKQAAGDPAMSLDADALAAAARPRHRWVPGALATTAVGLVAAGVTLHATPSGVRSTTSSARPTASGSAPAPLVASGGAPTSSGGAPSSSGGAPSSSGGAPSERPSWSLVGSDVSSIAVTVSRRATRGSRGGAPTVHQVFTGAPARQLAGRLDRIASSGPEGRHSCPAQFVVADDRVVVHRPSGDLVLDRSGGACAFTAVVTRAGSHDSAYLAGGELTATVLHTLGLPGDYGYR